VTVLLQISAEPPFHHRSLSNDTGRPIRSLFSILLPTGPQRPAKFVIKQQI